MKDGVWKILAIVFICLFVLETVFVVLIYSVGSHTIGNENICRNDVCGFGNNFTSFYYDSMSDNCYCYFGSDVVKVKYIG